MDLLNLSSRTIPTTRGVATAAVTLAAVALAGCGPDASGDGEDGDPRDSVAAPTADPRSSPAQPVTLPDLEPIRPDERVVGRGGDTGPATGVLAGRTEGLVVVYGVCAAPGAELRLTLTLPRPEELSVPCDGIVSRAQVLTTPGEAYAVDAAAPDGVAWQVLVTSRREG